VTEELADGVQRWSMDAFSCSFQQRISSDEVTLYRAVRIAVEEELKIASLHLDGLEAVKRSPLASTDELLRRRYRE
jgi:hypothetical protein